MLSTYRVTRSQILYLEYSVFYSGLGIQRTSSPGDPEEVRTVEGIKEPSNLQDVRAYLGLLGFYQNFVPGSELHQNLSAGF